MFVRNSDGSAFRTIASFLVEAGGLRVLSVDGEMSLSTSRIIPGSLSQGSLIPFTHNAGSAGNRTGLLTLVFPEGASSLATCRQLGLDIVRSSGAGRTSVVFTDLTVLRTEQEGDRDRTGTGLLGGLDGGYPTKAPCTSACVPCPVASIAITSSASYDSLSIAPDSIASIFGSQLANSTNVASQFPLPTTLGGTTVRVRDADGHERLAPLFFVSATQINYLVPKETASGPAVIIVTDGEGNVSTGWINISPVAPGLFSANADGQGVGAAYIVRAKPDGTQIIEELVRYDAGMGKFLAVALDPGPASDRLFLVLFGTGLRNYENLPNVSVKVGGQAMTVASVTPHAAFVGLDQVNVELTRSALGQGTLEVELKIAAKTSNHVSILVN